MTDSFLYRSLPAFTGLLVFMPACGSNDSPSTGSETDASSSGADTSTTSPSTTDAPTTTTVDDTSSSEGSPETTDATEDTGPATCSDDSMCAKNLPDGWFGPLIYARTPDGVEPPECPTEFDDPGPELLDGFSGADPAECSCECDPSGGPSCYSSFILGSPNSCYGCYNYYENCYNQVSEACTNVDVSGNAHFQSFGGYYGGGTCTADTEEHVPPINWEAQIKTCELNEAPLSCQGDGICVPPPVAGFESVWCLYQQGDVGCPAGVFNTKHKFYMGAEDNRECSDCTCGSIAASCASAELLIFEGPDCAGEPVTSMAPNTGSCEPVIAGSVAVDYGLQGGCPVASPPHAMGTAEPTGVFTFCCTG